MRGSALVALAFVLVATRATAEDANPGWREGEPLGCIPSSAAAVCCPAACAAKKSSSTKADKVLRACLRGLECSASDVASATVFLRCGDCR
jgi:hypothetical protein